MAEGEPACLPHCLPELVEKCVSESFTSKNNPAAMTMECPVPRDPGILDLKTVVTLIIVSVPVTFYYLTALKPRF